MTEPNSIAIYRMSELSSGENGGYLGYTDYVSVPFSVNSDVPQLIAPDQGRVMSTANMPQRVNTTNSAAFDPPLTVLAEDGCVMYLFVLDSTTNSTFDRVNPIFPIPVPIPGTHSVNFVEQVTPILINGDCVAVSVLLDSDQVRQSQLGINISNTEHGAFVRIPFCFNIVDKGHGFPQWAIDDHRDEPTLLNSHIDQEHDHDQSSSSVSENSLLAHVLDHEGVHPPASPSKAEPDHDGVHPPSITAAPPAILHDGVHPKSIADYFVVRLH